MCTVEQWNRVKAQVRLMHLQEGASPPLLGASTIDSVLASEACSFSGRRVNKKARRRQADEDTQCHGDWRRVPLPRYYPQASSIQLSPSRSNTVAQADAQNKQEHILLCKIEKIKIKAAAMQSHRNFRARPPYRSDTVAQALWPPVSCDTIHVSRRIPLSPLHATQLALTLRSSINPGKYYSHSVAATVGRAYIMQILGDNSGVDEAVQLAPRAMYPRGRAEKQRLSTSTWAVAKRNRTKRLDGSALRECGHSYASEVLACTIANPHESGGHCTSSGSASVLMHLPARSTHQSVGAEHSLSTSADRGVQTSSQRAESDAPLLEDSFAARPTSACTHSSLHLPRMRAYAALREGVEGVRALAARSLPERDESRSWAGESGAGCRCAVDAAARARPAAAPQASLIQSTSRSDTVAQASCSNTQ
ncbi:hypothetical protein B0H14DRAFT_2622933 [Mycena olivaceomarginata]|nr:hypothetical protein B0H14DRAFT_2622933 [Mycena olivaceomarginata]